MSPTEGGPIPSEAARSLVGALRFCRFDRTAASAFDPSPAAALRSFWAAFYGLPFYAVALALGLWHSPHRPDDLWLYALVQVIAYVAHTAAFPLGVLGLARLLGHVAQWPLFVTAQNWFGLPQVVALLVCVTLDQTGVLGPVGLALLLAVQLYSFAVEGFISWATLGVKPLAAFAIVLLDIVIGFGIDELTAGLF
ncbi:MAG TPA: hypothetical protein VGV37_14745 [Aliidongia sp.]|uniref:hypothetical protein n=1 Tax=Aliidongia sp. TaxID=1914230 RepID=UPI002DDC9712|nr:hypothetical protein [Aliidongia sp.]HEV2675800.1 hypothetical protein [Aliidongia sp.]